MPEEKTSLIMPYQERWFSDRSSVKVIVKSRRIGLTFVSALEAVAEAAKGKDAFYLGYDAKMSRQFVEACKTWAAVLEALYDESITDDPTMTEIRFKNGGKIITLSSAPRNLRGKQGLIIIDEAAFHDDLQSLIKAGVAVTMWGGRLSIISTHFGDANPFNVLVREIQEGKKPYSLHKCDIDQALDDGLFKTICWVRGIKYSKEAESLFRKNLFDEYGDFAQEELLCIPGKSSSAYFSHDLLLRACKPCNVHRFDFGDDVAQMPHVYEQRAQEIVAQVSFSQKALQACIGVDFGRTQDISAIAIYDTSRDMVSVPIAFVELFNAPFLLQECILNALIAKCGCVVGIACDGTGNGSFLAERMVQSYGTMADNVKITQAWYADSFGKLKEGMQSHRIYVPQDVEILHDLASVQLIDGIPKIPKARNMSSIAEDGRKKARHGDSAVAIALAVSQIACKTISIGGISVHERKGTHRQEKRSQEEQSYDEEDFYGKRKTHF